jgi:hypothetical protein
MKYILISILLLLSTTTLLAEDKTYLCDAEESSGYDYKNGRWVRDRFTPDDSYLVKLKETKWSVYEFEVEYEHDSCEPVSEGVLKCSIRGDFTMNMKTMKFSVTDTAPYVNSTRKNRDSVVLTLGTCVSM